MVTAEFALVLPVVVVVLTLALAALAAATDQLRCVDAVRVGARAAARGDTVAAVEAAVRRAAPERSRVDVEIRRVVTVTVTAPPRALLAWLPARLRPSASATALPETVAP